MAERKVTFEEAFRAAGGVRRREPVPYPLTHDDIRRMCERRERILRIQFEDERFSDEDEDTLARLSLDNPDDAFLRYQRLVGIWHAWERGLRKRDEGRDAASLLLLSRAPVPIRIAGRAVPITSRSRAALIRLARHEAARDLLGDKIDELTARMRQLDDHRRSGRIGPLQAWRRKRALQRLTERVAAEWEIQWRGVLANAVTPDGRAALPEEAPDYWAQVTIEDESRILEALFTAGPIRYADARRDPARKPSKSQGEPVTFGTLLRIVEGQCRLPPMSLEDTDLFQVIHAVELGQRGTAEAETEEAFAA